MDEPGHGREQLALVIIDIREPIVGIDRLRASEGDNNGVTLSCDEALSVEPAQ